MKKKLLGFWDYTVILTYCGMAVAFWGILQSIQEKYWNAVICLMIAGVCDMFDGAVAATKNRTKQEKIFGIQIDSLSDLISFGASPAIFVYMISGKNLYIGILAVLYVLAALVRLAYFNVLEEERQSQTEEKRDSYLGCPVTTIAILLPIIHLLCAQQIICSLIPYYILLILVGIGFIVPFKIKKPKALGKTFLVAIGVVEAVFIFLIAWGVI